MTRVWGNTCGMCPRPVREFDNFCGDACEAEAQRLAELDAPFTLEAGHGCLLAGAPSRTPDSLLAAVAPSAPEGATAHLHTTDRRAA